MGSNSDFLDPLLSPTIQDDGSDKTRRANINLVGFTITDDPTNDATVVTATGGGSGGSIAFSNLAALRAAAHADEQVATVLSPVGTWVYDADTGAGFVDDGLTIVKPTDVSVGADGRWYNVNASAVLPTIAALRLAVSGTQSSVSVQNYATFGDLGGGIFDYDPADTTTADNGGTVIVAGTRRYKRRYSGLVSVRWFGATGDGSTNDRPAIQAALDYFVAANIAVRLYFPKPSGFAYVINGKITIQGKANQTIWLEGEVAGQADSSGTRLNCGTPGTTALIDIVGGNGIELHNLDLHTAGNSKYGVWFRPDQGAALGAEKLILRSVNIFGPEDSVGAACLAIGPTSGNPTQASEIFCYDCKFTGVSGSSFDGVGFINISGGNAKNVYFYDCGFLNFKYALDLTVSSGPVMLIGCAISGCWSAGIKTGSGRIACLGLDFETNLDGCQLLVGDQGAGNGNVSFVDSEIFLVPPQGDRIIDWHGGHLRFESCFIQNQKELTILTATNATPIVCGLSAGHGLVTGDKVFVKDALGNTAANTASGTYWPITVSGNNITLVGSVGNGSYTGSSGRMEMEPKIFIGNPTDHTAKAGVFSAGNTYHPCADYLPIFDGTTGLRVLLPANAQANPPSVFSIGDVGEEAATAGLQTPLAPVTGRSLNFASLAAGVMHASSVGVVTSSLVTRAEEAVGTLLAQIKRWTGSAWALVGMKAGSLTDANATKAVADGSLLILPAATLSTNRTLTLSTTGAVPYETITVERYDTTANTYAVANGGGGGGTLYTFPVSVTRAAVFQMNASGTDWALVNTIAINAQVA